MVTDSENFYLSILDLLEDPDESQEVADLIIWWMEFIMHLFKLEKLSMLTLYKVEFFPIHPLCSSVSVQTVRCQKFVQDALPCKNKQVLVLHNFHFSFIYNRSLYFVTLVIYCNQLLLIIET